MSQSKRRGRRTHPAPEGRRRRRPPSLLLLLVVIVGALAVFFWPNPHAWQRLEPRLGRVRWVETRTDTLVEHPLAPAWVRNLHQKGIPWPTDLPLAPLGGSFGAPGSGDTTSAWYLIQSAEPTKELWFVDKSTLRLTDAQNREIPWPGGTGALLVDPNRRLQFLYLGVPRELSGKGAHLHVQFRQFQGAASQSVTLPF